MSMTGQLKNPIFADKSCYPTNKPKTKKRFNDGSHGNIIPIHPI